MTDASVASGIAYALGGGGALTLLMLLLRMAVQHASKSALATAGDSAERGIITTLRGEIERLEKLVDRQQTRVDELQKSVIRMQQAMISAQSSALICMAIVQSMCGCDNGTREKLIEHLKQIINMNIDNDQEPAE